MKIEISKKSPAVISWCDADGWVRREKATYKNLRKHGFSHCLFLSVLLLLLGMQDNSKQQKGGLY